MINILEGRENKEVEKLWAKHEDEALLEDQPSNV
jgi:hypothetical protein